MYSGMTDTIGSPSRAEGTPPEVSDEELMARTRLGERAAFACLVERHQDGLVAYLSRLTGSRDRGEDLGQETFLRTYRFASRYREEGHFKAYLFRIATNLARSEARSERRRRLFLPFFRGIDSIEPSISCEMLQGEADALVAQAIANLPMRLREPVVLHEIEDWPYTEIARALGCREGTVKSRIHRGRQALRRALEPYWQGGARCRAPQTISKTTNAPIPTHD